MIDEKTILSKTHYGLNIFAHILREYYPNEVVIELSGKQCKPARNPFNANQLTLDIFNQDWIFQFRDVQVPEFCGNAFEFAARHYQLLGQELLERINSDLNLHIGESQVFYQNKKRMIEPGLAPIIELPKFSFFKRPITNTHPNGTMTVRDVYEVIISEKYKQQTNELRSIRQHEEARRYKARNFDSVTFSGVFTKRNDSSLVKHSGLMTIDFDHVENLPALKEFLLADKYFQTELMFESPSGDGLKWIIPIDLAKGTHREWFEAIANYLEATYNLKIDSSGKDISRACFLPYSPLAYINPSYL